MSKSVAVSCRRQTTCFAPMLLLFHFDSSCYGLSLLLKESMAYKDAEMLQVSKFNNSLEDNSGGHDVYATHGRVLGTYIFWCCDQQCVGMGWKVATTEVEQSVRGLFHIVFQDLKTKLFMLFSGEKNNPAMAPCVCDNKGLFCL